MSENIQSIANGTFVLGQTSATNFQAGPGISITQPSEGTVRIANDETVLWSGDYNTIGTVITATENFKNFERVGLYFADYPDVHYCVPFQTSGVLGFCKGAGVANCWLQVISVNQSANTMAITAGKSINFGGFTNSTMGNLTALTGLPDGFHLNKIVGLNRISGSNA